eukprot:gene1446-32820_t
MKLALPRSRLVKGGVAAPRNATSQVHPCAWKRGQESPRQVKVDAINLNRREYMDNMWKRQEEREKKRALFIEELEKGSCGVEEVEDLEHFNLLLDAAGSRLVVLFIYSKACGICKDAMQRFELMCDDTKNQKGRVLFLAHNIIDPYDHVSDIARMHKVKAVPCFLFMDEGALVRRLSLRDIRILYGTKGQVQDAIQEDILKFRSVFKEMVYTRAPGSRA